MILSGVMAAFSLRAELPVQVNDVWLQKARGIAVAADEGEGGDETGAEEPSVLDAVEEEEGDALEFFNKDVLHGQFVRATPDTGLVWQHPDAAEEITFDLKNVRSVKLIQKLDEERDDLHKIRLVNGNVVSGQIIGLSADDLTIQTWYAGMITIKRSMIAGIALRGESAPASYAGPNSLDEWEVPAGDWRFENNVLYGLGNGLLLGKKLSLPEMARIDVEIAWRGNLNINLGLLADNANVQSCQRMVGLNLNRHYISFYSKVPNRHHGHGNAQVQELMQKNHAKFTFCLDRKEKIMVLFVDDIMAKEWRHNVECEDAESFLALNANPGGGIALRRIRISEWDGKRGLEDIAREPEQEKDLVVFQNADQVSGLIEAIADGQMKLATAFATMDVPLQRVQKIEMKTAGRAAANAVTGDIQVKLTNDDSITLQLTKCDETGLIGNNQAIGEVTVSQEAIKELLFRVADERHQRKNRDAGNFFDN
jgi:hypothetical protein